jgi:NAD(P)-dependent dehydrogenase (short-subunit alcohol dehydrogenase family)
VDERRRHEPGSHCDCFDLDITYRTDEAGAQETLQAVRAAGTRCKGWTGDEDPTTIERSNLPLGRPGHAREIAAWVAFLASEKSTYATGASFVVDGGLTLMAAELSS